MRLELFYGSSLDSDSLDSVSLGSSEGSSLDSSEGSSLDSSDPSLELELISMVLYGPSMDSAYATATLPELRMNQPVTMVSELMTMSS